MPDVQFEEETYLSRRQTGKKSLFIRLVLATGIVATDSQAEYVLLALSIVAIILAFLIPSLFGNSQQPIVPQTLIDAAMSHRLPL